MFDGELTSFWNSLQRVEQRVEAEATEAERQVYRTIYGYKSRVMRLRAALAASGPIARQTVARKLEGIKLDAIWDILFAAVRDMALYYGGSVVLGTAIGAGLGSLAGGVGAIPGAAIGAEAGSLLGEWALMFLGLKMLAEGLVNTIPPALRLYVQGFRIAWGPVDSDRPDARYSAEYHHGEDMAAHRFADGHVLMIMAILIAIVAYLLRGKSEEALMQAVRKSERLGTKMADWLAENKERLLKEESLKPKVAERAPSQEAEPGPLNRRQGPPQSSSTPGSSSPVTSPSPVSGAGTTAKTEPQWLQRIRAGNAFDDAQAVNYPYNEVYIDNPAGGYTRLDSYNPDLGEIVSRKYTQLADIQEDTAVRYINEIPAKYPVGATVADVPSSGSLAGATLQGQYILEVPVQANPVPQAVLDAADNAGVIIRDVNGTIY